MTDFPYLFSSLEIGGRILRNRVVVTAHLSNFADRAGHATELHQHYYRERAAGGAALIITEGLVVDPSALSGPNHARIDHDEAIDSWARLAEVVHEEGALIFGQLNHIGRYASADRANPSVITSSMEPFLGGDVPHVMTMHDIDGIVMAFAQAAERAEAAGFDGVEVHAGHGYLVSQFLSPSFNHRVDGYGGSLENRCRILVEVLRAIDDRVSPSFVRGIRLTGDEFTPNGIEPEDAAVVVDHLRGRERLDYVSITEGSHLSAEVIVADMEFERGGFRHLARFVRRAVPDPPPIFSVGRINTPELAEDIIATGDADAVGMTRAHIADPYLLRKTREGRRQEIRTCIACNQGCIGGIGTGGPLGCLQNPAAGREATFPGEWPSSVDPVRRVVVVGGGPAGLEAAWVAAARGHRVTLLEQHDELGGLVNLYRSVPSRREFAHVVEFRMRMLDKFGVEVRTGCAVDEALVAELSPDHLIVATGAESVVPDTLTTADVNASWTVEQAMGQSASGGRVVIYDIDGHAQAVTAAEHLAALGWTVTIAVPGDGIAARMPAFSRVTALKRMARLGVRFESRVRAVGREDDALVVADVWSGETRRLGADTLVAVGYRRANDELGRMDVAEGCRVEVIGDARSPRLMQHAIRDGYESAWSLHEEHQGGVAP